MTITYESHGPVDVIELPANLALPEVTNVNERLQELIAQGHGKLVLDLASISFIDSTGLSVLISARKSAVRVNGDVVLLNPSARARILIELTRLHEVFNIFIDKEAAVEYFSQDWS